MSVTTTMPVLITYASSRGSTKEVAERIASRLHADGIAVDCRPVDRVYSVENYSAVIMGSAVHAAKWLLDAQRFLDVEAVGLQLKPLWAFSLGSAPAGMPSWIQQKAAKKEQKAIENAIKAKVPKVREHRLFAGKDDGSSWPSPIRGLYHCLGGRFGDFRDWKEIDEWADSIAKELATGA
jgi:menaquinone-dependent protoporphyrinogen oxidase